jgi:hypothetical protein
MVGHRYERYSSPVMVALTLRTIERHMSKGRYITLMCIYKRTSILRLILRGGRYPLPGCAMATTFIAENKCTYLFGCVSKYPSTTSTFGADSTIDTHGVFLKKVSTSYPAKRVLQCQQTFLSCVTDHSCLTNNVYFDFPRVP